MCCESGATFDLPPQVIEALAQYRRLLDERGWDWGDEGIDFFRVARFSQFGPAFEEFRATGDWAKAVRNTVATGDTPPAGIVLVRIDEGGRLHPRTGPARLAVAGHPVTIDVVIDNAADAELAVNIAGHHVADRQVDLAVAANGVAVETIDVDGANPVFTIATPDSEVRIDTAVQTVAAATLHLVSPHCCRWSVTDATGGAWFPDGVLPKFDFHHRPLFHGHEITMTIPAGGDLDIVCTRGLEFERQEITVAPRAGETVTVSGDPARLFDPAATGWYGGDMHVHMNYSGDLVCTPADAARMQGGEGLHLVNLVAANCITSRVYDHDMLEQFPGQQLPWSNDEAVAQMGVEYRNDLLGHVHALGPSGPPPRYYTGHDRSDHPEDWPPNRIGCEELRGLGATVGYCHPATAPFPEDGSTRRFFRTPRSVEARELVADAALGVVDSVDLISPTNDEGAVFLYHRLLSCGLRLAATAGTDVFLSFSHSGTFSNPPGWGRVYGQLDGRPLSVEAFKDAIRAGRTLVTNGPWLTLDVNGHGPGTVLDIDNAAATTTARATVVGADVERLSLVGPDGVIAENDGTAPLEATVSLDRGPTWVAAIARGPSHARSNTLDQSVLAHTSPVYVDIAGNHVARQADAQWCLAFLDEFEALLREHGHFDPATREAHLRDHEAVLEEARAFYRQVSNAASAEDSRRG